VRPVKADDLPLMLSGSFAKKEVFSIILRENRVQAFQNEEKCGAWFGFLRNFQREEGTYLRCSPKVITSAKNAPVAQR
jgi:hypothetical protein